MASIGSNRRPVVDGPEVKPVGVRNCTLVRTERKIGIKVKKARRRPGPGRTDGRTRTTFLARAPAAAPLTTSAAPLSTARKPLFGICAFQPFFPECSAAAIVDVAVKHGRKKEGLEFSRTASTAACQPVYRIIL